MNNNNNNNNNNNKRKVIYLSFIVILIFSLSSNIVYIRRNRKYELYLSEEIRNKISGMGASSESASLILNTILKHNRLTKDDVYVLTMNYQEFTICIQDLVYLYQTVRNNDYQSSRLTHYHVFYNDLTILNNRLLSGNEELSDLYSKETFQFMRRVTRRYNEILNSYDDGVSMKVKHDEWIDLLQEIDSVRLNNE